MGGGLVELNTRCSIVQYEKMSGERDYEVGGCCIDISSDHAPTGVLNPSKESY